MLFEIFLQGEVHKADDVGVFINDDETKTALEDTGHGRHKVFIWTCAFGLYGKSFPELFCLKGLTGKGQPGESFQCQMGP